MTEADFRMNGTGRVPSLTDDAAGRASLAKARAVIAMQRQPSHRAFARKPRLMLEGAGVDPRLIAYLEADVRMLGRVR